MVTEKYISKLLFDHDCVIVPGLGGFIANYSPAKIHPVHHTFSPPFRSIAFNVSLRANDGLLINAIKNGLGISYTDAAALLSGEVEVILEKIYNGGQLSLGSIGTLFNDRENNLQFNPDQSVNYNSDSFGLSTFTSPPIRREGIHDKISRKLRPSQAVRSARLLPVSLKWAAVFLPLIGIGLWSAFNPEKINSLYNNTASLIPTNWSSDLAPEKSVVKPNSATKTIKSIPKAVPVTIVEAPVAEESAEVAVTTAYSCYIIVGAFSVEQNAINLVEELKSKGYESSITGQNRRGLYMVSLQGFNDKKAAAKKMSEIRDEEFPGVWLLSL